jgi:hypothetical protein
MANSTVESLASFRFEWPWPRLVASRARTPSCQLSRLADPAVDLALDEDAEEGVQVVGPVVDDPEPLEILARRVGARRPSWGGSLPSPRGRYEDADRASPPGQLGDEDVRRPLVALERLPAEPLGEPVESVADRQPPTMARKCDRLWGRSPCAGRMSE